MYNKEIEDRLLSLIIRNDGHTIAGRSNRNWLEKNGFYDYIMNRYDDNSTDTLEEALYRVVHHIDVIPKCRVCGCPLKFNTRNNTYPQWCSPAHRNNDPEVLAKNKTGVTRGLKKAYAERGDEIKAKRSKSLYEHFGGDSSSCSPFGYRDILDKAKESLLEKYGTDNVLRLKENRQKIKEGNRKCCAKKRLEDQNLDVEFTERKTVIVHNGCPIHGDIELDMVTFNNRTKPERIHNSILCPICNAVDNHSGQEKSMMSFLDSLGVSYTDNNRKIIKPKEHDFYIPDYNLAIELNGIYYHSTERHDKNYHKDKMIACLDKGIRLLYFWDFDTGYNQEGVFSIIKNALRKIPKFDDSNYEIKSLSNQECGDFIKKYKLRCPLLGNVSAGLYVDNILLGVISFDKCDDVVQIRDFSIKHDNDYNDILERLIDYVKSLSDTVKLSMSADWYDRDFFKSLGFTEESLGDCNVIWSDYNAKVYLGNKIDEEYLASHHYKQYYDSGTINLLYKK